MGPYLGLAVFWWLALAATPLLIVLSVYLYTSSKRKPPLISFLLLPLTPLVFVGGLTFLIFAPKPDVPHPEEVFMEVFEQEPRPYLQNLRAKRYGSDEFDVIKLYFDVPAEGLPVFWIQHKLKFVRMGCQLSDGEKEESAAHSLTVEAPLNPVFGQSYLCYNLRTGQFGYTAYFMD